MPGTSTPYPPAATWPPPPPSPPSGPGVFERRWPRPERAARPAIPIATGLIAIMAGGVLIAPIGVQWPVLAAALASVAVFSARPAARPVRGTGRDGGSAGAADRAQPQRRGSDVLLGLLAVALIGVAAVRTSGPMFTLCLLAALGLSTLAALSARSWPGSLLAPMLVPVATVRGALWSGRGLRGAKLGGPRDYAAWLRGGLLGALVLLVVGTLLTSADGAFAGLSRSLLPDLHLTWWPVRVLIVAVTAGLALALCFGAAAPVRWPQPPDRRSGRPAAEWAVPVAVMIGLLGAFLTVQVVVLFGSYPPDLLYGHLTPAERARQGFGQLVAVSLVAVLVLSWAGYGCNPVSARHRRLLTVLGGPLLVLVLVLVGSALRRLWLYEQTFGWTVLRLEVGAFELWLGLMLVGSAAAWLTRRTASLPRLVAGGAGLGLLVLALAGPDAVVASWNVDRYQRTGRFDVAYAARLSDDAVPALARLPHDLRSCVLARPATAAPWYAANVSRIRAGAVLRTLRPLPDRSACSASPTSPP